MDDRTFTAEEAPPTAVRDEEPLSRSWLVDQSIAFAATLLGELDIALEARSVAAVRVIIGSLDRVRNGLVSDSTLGLVTTIDPTFLQAAVLREQEFGALADLAEPLSDAVRTARQELARRDKVTSGVLNRILISHTVYLFRRPQLPARKILRWLQRAVPAAVPGVKRILRDLQEPDSPRLKPIEEALAKVRDTELQDRDRLEHLDRFHALVLECAFEQRAAVSVWWTRICMAYRSSLFCWPLLAEIGMEEAEDSTGTTVRRLRGLSLPISLFVIEDGKSEWRPEFNPRGQKIWFKNKLTRREESR